MGVKDPNMTRESCMNIWKVILTDIHIHKIKYRQEKAHNSQ